MNRNIKLLVFDFDGTALGGHEPYACFPLEFAAFLDKLSKNGILWATNTTWAPKEQYKLMTQSGVKSRPALLTGQTGRLVAKVKSGKVVFDSGHGRMIKAVDLAFRKENRALVRSVLEKFIAGDEIEQFSCNDFNQNIISYKAQEGKALQAWKLIRPLIASGAFYLWEPDKKSSNSLLPYYMNKGAAL
ncbi:MAG: hypothetical protein PHV82_19175, partial [Victivallaceae bacterium]|nr:hypothetical protein [Victivallaceae bacterium]